MFLNVCMCHRLSCETQGYFFFHFLELFNSNLPERTPYICLHLGLYKAFTDKCTQITAALIKTVSSYSRVYILLWDRFDVLSWMTDKWSLEEITQTTNISFPPWVWDECLGNFRTWRTYRWWIPFTTFSCAQFRPENEKQCMLFYLRLVGRE